MHRHLYQWQAHPGLILNQHGVSLLHLRGFLLLHQQIPSGLTQRQKAGLHVWIIEVLTIPSLYCSHRAQLKVIISIHREQWPISNVTDNVTIDNIVRHLTLLGIPDHKVREAHHYAVEWLRSTAASTSRPEEAAEASTVYQRWQRHTNYSPEDTPLVNEPKWWTAPRGARCIEKAPAKRKRDAVDPSSVPQSSSRRTEPAPSISVSIPPGRPANDPPKDTAGGLPESIHASTSRVQSHSHPDLTQVRTNQHDSMEVDFLSNPNHPDGWGGSPIVPRPFEDPPLPPDTPGLITIADPEFEPKRSAVMDNGTSS